MEIVNTEEKRFGENKRMDNSVSPKTSLGISSDKIRQLNPIVVENLLRVGGRCVNSKILNALEKSPIIIPKKTYIAKLISRHYHNSTFHQGRSMTMSAIRQAGFWIIGCNAPVAKLIQDCVVCKKLRGVPAVQKMDSLPKERSEPSPPLNGGLG